jgi:cytochrome P450
MKGTTVEFDFTDPQIAGPEFWDAVSKVREAGPLVWAEANGGHWITASYETILRIAQDWEDFGSTEGVALGRPDFETIPRMVPVEIDPPRHRAFRRQVNPALTVKAMSPLDDEICAIADELIDDFIDRGSCDLAVDFARKFPGTVFFRLLVHCTDEDFQLVEPAARQISFESGDNEKLTAATARLRAWAGQVFASRAGQRQPAANDLVDAVMRLTETDDGVPWLDEEHRTALQILAQGGIGTSANLIGSIMLALSRDRELQDRVRGDLSLIPGLVEEVLRLEAPVPLMFRTATRDIEVEGQQVRKGDKVCLIFGGAGRDPAVFDHPAELDLERPHCRHLAFGAGVHRCIGSNLARQQARIAIGQLVTRLGEFWVPEGGTVQYSSRQARGPLSFPLAFTGPPR